MTGHDSNLLCEQAELYYYDFLDKRTGAVPYFIIDHIEHCQFCRKQIKRLADVLPQHQDCTNTTRTHKNPTNIIWLRLHFAYLGKEVDCDTARPFLPSLIVQGLEIRIPTPITVHIDNCPQCLEALEAIRKLDLNLKQLCQLSQLFSEKRCEDGIGCSKAQGFISSVVSMNFDKISKEALKHLCCCPDCRRMLYQYRNLLQKGCPNATNKLQDFPCEEVSDSDLFDYVIPYGFDPAKDPYLKFRQSLTSHLHICPICLAKMQELHKTVFGIAERPNSGVITRCHINEFVGAKTTESDDIYSGAPLKIEVINKHDRSEAEQPGYAVNISHRNRLSAINTKPLLKIGAAAAAIVLIAAVSFLNISEAKAVTLEKIYRAIQEAKNVYIASFAPDKKEPIQKRWVSRTLNLYISKTENQLVLWDIGNGLRKGKQVTTGVTDTTPLSAEMTAEIKNMITGSLGLVPFVDLSAVPADAEWERVIDSDLIIGANIEVYDLVWSVKAFDGSLVLKKWRIFTNMETSLPRKVEFYQKSIPDGEYCLEYTKVIKYLEESEIQQVISEMSF